MIKPITILFEISNPFQIKLGYYKANFKDNITFTRVWWLWFAIAWVRMSMPDFHNHIAKGKTEWREENHN